jgi:serine/threonine protein kinase
MSDSPSSSSSPSPSSSSSSDFELQYEVLEEIGKGSFGTVHRVRRRSDERVVVAKALRYGQMTEREKVAVRQRVACASLTRFSLRPPRAGASGVRGQFAEAAAAREHCEILRPHRRLATGDALHHHGVLCGGRFGQVSKEIAK